MRVRLSIGLLLTAWGLFVQAGVESAAEGGAQAAARPATSPAAAQRAVLDKYCVGCHSQQQKARGVVPTALDSLSVSDVSGHAKEWEAVVRKMRAGLMPPAGMPRPDPTTHEMFLGWLEGELDRAALANPNPGRKEPLHRLNRTEYRNAVRDLLHLDIDVAALLPAGLPLARALDAAASTATPAPTFGNDGQRPFQRDRMG